MSDPLAVIALITAAAGPAVLVVVTTRERRAETRETWKRQDTVAASLLAANAVAAANSARAQTETQSRLTQIHTLVNSELTEAQRRELAATKSALVMMREVVDIKRRAGVDPSVEAEDVLLEMEIRVRGMEAGLAAKDVATAAAERARHTGDE